MPRTRQIRLSLCLLAAIGTHTQLAPAQDDTPGWQPVDQAVGDLDLRATSSRRVEQGIGQFGQTGSLYQRPNDGQGWFLNGQEVTQQYQLRQPGFTAWIDRPDYIVQDPLGEMSLNNAPAVDGQFTDLVPPNTVFDLSNSAQQIFIPYTEDADTSSPRVNTRIDGWADTPTDPTQVGTPRPVAHSLPPHLMKRRAERRAQEAEASTEPIGSDKPATAHSPSPDPADSPDAPASPQDPPAEAPHD